MDVFDVAPTDGWSRGLHHLLRRLGFQRRAIYIHREESHGDQTMGHHFTLLITKQTGYGGLRYRFTGKGYSFERARQEAARKAVLRLCRHFSLRIEGSRFVPRQPRRMTPRQPLAL